MEGRQEVTVDVDREEFIIGRLPKNDLSLPFTEVSRQHCRLMKLPSGEWLAEDLGSTNGTLLNQVRLKSIQRLEAGDVLQIGNTLLFIERASGTQGVSASAPATAPAEVKTILRSAEELQQQWMDGDEKKDPYSTEHIANARLKYIVEIAKGLSSAESIEAIFSQVQAIVFRELRSVERLALLIDVTGSGELKLFKAAARKQASESSRDDSKTRILRPTSAPLELSRGQWISRTICQKVFAERVAIKSIDAQTDKRFEGERSILFKGITGVLAVPLWDEKKVVGVLYADARLGLSHLDPSEDQDLSFFSTIANLVASSVQRWLLTQKLQKEGQIRQRLERYHSPAVVQQLISVGAKDNFKPVEADISVLFADIVGFTALSERLSPTQIAQLLNLFFEEMMQSLFATGGTLDKFIGDCIMAFFGAPESQGDHADRAVTAAKGMLKRLQELNLANTWPQPLQLRIAINSGRAVVGDVGSSQRVDYTVLGATVNLASRLEAVCRPDECVISEDTYRRLKFKQGFYPLGERNFKGIDRPILVYRGKWSGDTRARAQATASRPPA